MKRAIASVALCASIMMSGPVLASSFDTSKYVSVTNETLSKFYKGHVTTPADKRVLEINLTKMMNLGIDYARQYKAKNPTSAAFVDNLISQASKLSGESLVALENAWLQGKTVNIRPNRDTYDAETALLDAVVRPALALAYVKAYNEGGSHTALSKATETLEEGVLAVENL